ncbi:MAG: metalloregulator ArsR/SmtB family transcription factor [Myxococcota bacterium]
MNLERTHELCRLLADGTRLRLLALLSQQALAVGELTELLGVAQSRVSTHLGKLKAEDLVEVEKSGSGSTYRARIDKDAEAGRLWQMLMNDLDDPLLATDQERAAQIVRARNQTTTWADSVAGAMERHYSPGRTWEAVSRGVVGLTRLGHVLDIASGDGALAELLAPRAERVTCIDSSRRVVEAGRERLATVQNIDFVQGDMHALPFDDARFDQVLLLHALPYAAEPDGVVAEAGRVLRPGGSFVAQTLLAHQFRDEVKAFDHVQDGFEVERVRGMVEAAGLEPTLCEVTHQERRKPHFKIITVHAHRPS